MKKALIIAILGFSVNLIAQERIFFIGYTKNFISKDSSNVTFNFDLNRIPGSTEKLGGTFLYNKDLGEKWGIYLKPTADINIGSGTTTAPNNISIGLPFGLAYDGIAFSEIPIELGPELVADKDFDNYLLYGTLGAYYRYEYKKDVLFNISAGGSISHGTRTYSDEAKKANGYSRFTVPVYLKFCFWNAGPDDSPYFVMHITNTFKYNNVFEDTETITPDPTMVFNTAKLDIYFIPRLALSFQYQYGYEEPLFKKINSFSIGLTFAKI